MFFYKVEEQQAVILERFHKFNSVVDSAGLKGKLPGKFLKVAARIPLDITQREVNLQTKTSDNIFASVPTTLHLQVVDAYKFHYKSDRPYEQAESKITAVMKQLTSNMEFAHLYQARESLGNDVRDKVGKDIEDLYGLKIIDVIVDQPVAPPSVQQAYNSAKSSEQVAISTLNAAQANKQAAILNAEARKEELRLDGEGVAEQRGAVFQNFAVQVNQLVKDGIPMEKALETTLQIMQLDTLREVGKSGNVVITTLDGKDNKDNNLAQMQAALKAFVQKGDDQPSAPTSNRPAPPQPRP
jgi:regulator of protease activity HflC (stomatin/prohibitin superfamily)